MAKEDHQGDTLSLLCPYSDSPYEDCYCRHFNGRTIPYIVRYCLEGYRNCPIYDRHISKNRERKKS